jgi:hypothetical protein
MRIERGRGDLQHTTDRLDPAYARYSLIKLIISEMGGRALPEQNARMPFSGCQLPIDAAGSRVPTL